MNPSSGYKSPVSILIMSCNVSSLISTCKCLWYFSVKYENVVSGTSFRIVSQSPFSNASLTLLAEITFPSFFSRGISSNPIPWRERIISNVRLYCLVTVSSGSVPTKRTRMFAAGAISLAKRVTSCELSTTRSCSCDLLKYSENVKDERTNFPLSTTRTFSKPSHPALTRRIRSSNEKNDLSSCTTNTINMSHFFAHVSIK